ncbi:MAG: hypothetical protein ACLTCB_07000 [Merdibacter sp.]
MLDRTTPGSVLADPEATQEGSIRRADDADSYRQLQLVENSSTQPGIRRIPRQLGRQHLPACWRYPRQRS